MHVSQALAAALVYAGAASALRLSGPAALLQIRGKIEVPLRRPAESKLYRGSAPASETARRIAATIFGTGGTAASAWLAAASAAVAEVEADAEEVVQRTQELPPVWIPIAVAIAVIGLIGVQQLSLGNVMDEEAKLGSMSGARAAKRSARDQSMFRKK